MKKILVIGMSGSGKSTLAIKLGKKINLPVIHLDNLFYKSRNETITKGEWNKKVARLVKRKEWIMDGYYPRTLDIRLKAADTVIFLDLPKWITIPRLIKAGIDGVRNGRVGQPEFLKTRLSGTLFRKVVSFSEKKLIAKLSEYPDKKVIIIKTNDQIQKFLQSLS